MNPAALVIDDMRSVKVGGQIRFHAWGCRDAVADARRAGVNDVELLDCWRPDGETPLGLIAETLGLTWAELLSAAVFLPCTAGCIEQSED